MVNSLSERAVLLFTGGAKGITAKCAIALSEVIPCTYVLMGSSQQSPPPEWALDVADDALLKQKIVAAAQANHKKLLPKEIEQTFRRIKGSLEIEETLSRIRANNAQVEYIHADVTDLQEVQSALSDVVARTGKITGLVHGAGRLADKHIERKTQADFQAVFDTKAVGLMNVIECLDAKKLELLVLFSSVAGAFGNVGQADYAMANEVLNKFALRFHTENPDCHTLAINWGPWDSGMVTPPLKKAFAEMGITLISNQEGAQRFVHAVLNRDQPSPQLVIGNAIRRPVTVEVGETELEVRRVLLPDENPFLLDHQIGPNRVLPATCAAAWMADTCEMLYPSYQFFQMENFRVYKGLVFADGEASEFVTKVQSMADTDSEEIKNQVRVTSTFKGREVLHYRSEITLRKILPISETWVNPNPWQVLAVFSEGRRYYDEKLLFHGPAFQGLKRVVSMTEDTLVTVCHLPQVSAEVQGQFAVRATNPYLNDVILQGLLAWSYQYFEAACLPAGIEKLEQYQRLPFGEDVYVDVQVQSHTATSIRVNAAVYDRRGQLLLACEGIEGTMSKALLPLFQESTTSMA